MLARCRATVFSLITRAAAISRLVAPAARQRRTSASRAVSPFGADGREAASVRRSAAAPSAVNVAVASSSLPLGGLAVAEIAVGRGEEHAHAGGLVGRVQLLPGAAGLAQLGQGLRRLALGEPHRAGRLPCGGTQGGAVEGRRGFGQLVAGLAGGGQVRRGDGDLDLRRAEPRAPQRVVGLAPLRAARRPAAAIVVRPCASRSSASPGWGSRPRRCAAR